MALSLTQNDRDPIVAPAPSASDAALPTLADWLLLALPARLMAEARWYLARRQLQRRAARQLRAGDGCLVAQLIARGDWRTLDGLVVAREGTE